MAEVLPVFEPGRTVTFTTQTTATGGSPMKLGTSDYTVGLATKATDVVVGQIEHDVAAGDATMVRLIGSGITQYATDQTIPVGAFVAPAGDGRVAKATAAPAIGVVVKASTTTDHWVHVLAGVAYTKGE